MKRVLITGANSYIGNSFENYMKQWKDDYSIDAIDMIDGSWRNKDFSQYDVVFHVAGIVHIKETKSNEQLYYTINRDLAYETAQKAKISGVKQFIFLSSMSVYGMDRGVIKKTTAPTPNNSYGKSKLQAEEYITKLQDTDFSVSVLRPPMVYGKGCKGNYTALSKLSKKLKVFPNISNKRSMIYEQNLCYFVKKIIDENKFGCFFPQNAEYVCTRDMVKKIGAYNNNVITFVPFMSFIKLLPLKVIGKVFGDLYYENTEDVVDFVDFDTSIRLTER